MKDIVGAWDDNDSHQDGSMAPLLGEGKPPPFNVKAKAKILNYDGAIDAEMLDACSIK